MKTKNNLCLIFQLIQWVCFRHNYLSGNDIISCITQCNDYMLYNTKGNLIAKYKYSDITSKFEWKVKHNVNIINAHNGTKLNEIYLILSIKSSDR